MSHPKLIQSGKYIEKTQSIFSQRILISRIHTLIQSGYQLYIFIVLLTLFCIHLYTVSIKIYNTYFGIILSQVV